ncbi:phospho-sugar mutase [Salininema proteolyticum]|uniref:Phospho-sugar mutase n=1 Tax=Salininema proteolyticum TaxID=1607685 RepID=A0ABV8U1A3_9ACTN
MSNELNLDDLKGTVAEWIADDPSESDRAELTDLLERLPETADELADRFSGRLAFGTAGLRGELRAGPNGMNLAVVSAAAKGLADWLDSENAVGGVVIGFDARYGSRDFALQTARIVRATGREAFVMPRTLPTPVLAWAVGEYEAAAGVMVTASHNPPRDNGYKVYLGRGLGGERGASAQIAPPVDEKIEAAINAVGRLADIPLGDEGTTLPEDILANYLSAIGRAVDADSPRDLSVVATPMHGVGGETLVKAFAGAGFAEPALVAEQAEPDPDFPTVSFPNPEEPGAMDLLLALAGEKGADVAIALDPDADRCAVAAPDGAGKWRALTGNETGVLLADHLMRKGARGTYATTIVSTTQLGRMCEARGVPYAETLTGFKWISRAADELAYGFEEALGYCGTPYVARDKDGISAALLVAEIAAGLKADGRTIFDRLDELAAEFGVHATGQVSVRVEDLSLIGDMMARLRASRPERLLGDAVTEYLDREDANVVTVRTADSRLVVRPSGTEPKLKAYLEVRVDAEGDVAAARPKAAERLDRLADETRGLLGIE